MNDELTPDRGAIDELEERAMLEALEALETGETSVSAEARPYLEVLASLPAGLDPVAPSAATREALMAAVTAEGGEAEVVDIAPQVAAASGRPSTGLPAWVTRVAAVVALALLGVSVVQYTRLSSQEERIARQAEEIERLQAELADIMPALGRRPPEWMAASGTELCALRPRQAAGVAPLEGEESKGWLFVRQDHQHWFVAVEGLAPAPEGHVYELWFRVEEELVSGGIFQPDREGRAILTSETMPNPVTGIAITLEPDNGDSVPSETMVLWGDEVMLVL